MCGHYDDPPHWHNASNTQLMYVVMCVVTALVVVAFIVTQVRHQPDEDPDNQKYEGKMKKLGCIHIIIVFYRCCFPTQMMGWFVWWPFVLSNVALARLLSTIAELAFASMIALTNVEIEKQRQKANVFVFVEGAASMWPKYTKATSFGFVGLVAVAQLESWAGLCYQNNNCFFWAEICWLVGYCLLLPVMIHTFLLANKLRTGAKEKLFDKNRRWYDAELYGFVGTVFTLLAILGSLFYDLHMFQWRYEQQVKQDNLLVNNPLEGFVESWKYQDPQRWDEIFSHHMFLCMAVYYSMIMAVTVFMSQGPQLNNYRQFDICGVVIDAEPSKKGFLGF
jgi:hypothetical protein